jgi:hypothetical protein
MLQRGMDRGIIWGAGQHIPQTDPLFLNTTA